MRLGFALDLAHLPMFHRVERNIEISAATLLELNSGVILVEFQNDLVCPNPIVKCNKGYRPF